MCKRMLLFISKRLVGVVLFVQDGMCFSFDVVLIALNVEFIFIKLL